MNGYGIESAFKMLRAGVKPPKEYNHELSSWKIVMIKSFRVLSWVGYITLGYFIYNWINGSN